MSSVEFFLFFSHFGARACTTKKTSLPSVQILLYHPIDERKKLINRFLIEYLENYRVHLICQQHIRVSRSIILI